MLLNGITFESRSVPKISIGLGTYVFPLITATTTTTIVTYTRCTTNVRKTPSNKWDKFHWLCLHEPKIFHVPLHRHLAALSFMPFSTFLLLRFTYATYEHCPYAGDEWPTKRMYGPENLHEIAFLCIIALWSVPRGLLPIIYVLAIHPYSRTYLICHNFSSSVATFILCASSFASI